MVTDSIPNVPAKVLIVDDYKTNRVILASSLKSEGFLIREAENGLEALEMMRAEPFDLILLDIMMPRMDGFETLEQMKAEGMLENTPVIMATALDDRDSIIQSMRMGATDYITKPIDRVLLRARIDACLERKRLRDQAQAYYQALEFERAKTEQLLLNVLPSPIAERLKQGEQTIVDSFDAVTVLFADIVNFTRVTATMEPLLLLEKLNTIFSKFDHLVEKHGLEKIKTLGDGYMAVSGVPVTNKQHAQAAAHMALDMRETIQEIVGPDGNPFQVRIGMCSGPVMAGIIGQQKFTYDLWGTTVNTAFRMQAHGAVSQIQVPAETYDLLKGEFAFEERGEIELKGLGRVNTWFLLSTK